MTLKSLQVGKSIVVEARIHLDDDKVSHYMDIVKKVTKHRPVYAPTRKHAFFNIPTDPLGAKELTELIKHGLSRIVVNPNNVSLEFN